jgi:hypothetical protein
MERDAHLQPEDDAAEQSGRRQRYLGGTASGGDDVTGDRVLYRARPSPTNLTTAP